MRKLISIFFLLGIFVIQAFATKGETECIAVHWMNRVRKTQVTTEDIASVIPGTPDTAFYAVNFKEGGWVLVVAHKVVKPILAYSNNGIYALQSNDSPANYYLRKISDKILQNKQEPISETVKQEWKNLTETSVAPLKSTSESYPHFLLKTAWGQGPPYNDLCPYDETKSIYANHKVHTGCGATAMGQLMYYYKYPAQGMGSNAYTPESHPEYGEQNADFSSAFYDYDQMVDSAYASNFQTAQLVYHCGVSVNMDYGPDESSSNTISIKNALENHFKFATPVTIISRENCDDTDWSRKINREINFYKRPVLYFGENDGSAHIFLIDGYDEASGMVHINWGWDNAPGTPNFWCDFFPYSDIYNEKQNAYFGVTPLSRPLINMPYFESFENGGSDWVLTGFSNVYASAAKTGSHCLRIQNIPTEKGPSVNTATFSFKVPPNGQLSFWVKRQSPVDSISKQLAYIMGEFGPKAHATIFDGQFNDTSWVNYTVNLSHLAGNNVRLLLGEITNAPWQSQYIMVDDVEITGEATGNGAISCYEYWIDHNLSGRVSTLTEGLEGIFDFGTKINVASIADGFHTLNCRFKDDNGAWSPVSSSAFYKKNVSGLAAYEYWFDGNYQQKTTTTSTENGLSNLMVSIDTGTLSEGIHALNFRFRNGTDWSPVVSKHFLKFSGLEEAFEYEYWYDHADSLKQKVTADVSSKQPLMVEFDLNHLADGLHFLNIRFHQSSGWSPVVSHSFYKMNTASTSKACAYWIDDNLDQMVSEHLDSSEMAMFNAEPDFTGLSKGYHTFNIRFRDAEGWGPVSTHTFFKGAGFTEGWAGYQYWVDTIPHPVFQDVSVRDSMLLSVQFEINGNSYENGEHVVHTRFFDRKGTYSPVVSMPIAIGMPVANAGDDFEATKNSYVSLDGSSSYDTNGDELFYSWGSPAEITLDDSTRMNPGFISPNIIEDQLFMFTLTVNDGFYVSDPDTVYIRVLNATTSETQHLTNRVLISGENHCFNATQTITVAGDGYPVIVQPNASATFIAGQSIRFLPGFHAQNGSYVSAYITTDGSFCDMLPQSLAQNVYKPEVYEKSVLIKSDELPLISQGLKVFPNPTNGMVTIVMEDFGDQKLLEIANISGQTVYKQIINDDKINIDISAFNKGLYIVTCSDSFTCKAQRVVLN